MGVLVLLCPLVLGVFLLSAQNVNNIAKPIVTKMIEPMDNTLVLPPEIGVAVVVDEHILEIRRFVDIPSTRTIFSGLPPAVKTETRVESTIGTSIMQVEVTEIVSSNQVRRIDGRTVSNDVLVAELAAPTPILIQKQSLQIDPLFSKIFNPESLVLLMPTSTTPTAVGSSGITSESVAPTTQPIKTDTIQLFE